MIRNRDVAADNKRLIFEFSKHIFFIMLWLVLGIEAILIIAIFVQMMRKRALLRSDDADPASGETKPDLSIELPNEENWE